MGFIEKLKSNYDYRKVDKFTKRRLSQSQFQSHDRQYYEQVYRDGVYIDPEEAAATRTPSHNHLHYKNFRWSLNDLLKKPHKKAPFNFATNQVKTSEAYTLGYARE